MSRIDLEQSMRSLAVGRPLDSYTGVVIHAGQNESGEEITFSAGNTNGYVLDIDNPIGTQEMANAILASLRMRGARYKPYDADGALLDPSAEIGDNVVVNGTDSVILSMHTNNSRLMAADISAPYDEEVDHEFTYVPQTQREFKRESSYARSRITQNAQQIQLEVARATSMEGELSSRITLTADAITSEVARATAAEGTLSTRIEQRLDRITLSVSSSAGSSTFTLKDGSTTLDTKSLDLSVKAVNISGTLTIGQLPSDVATDEDIPTKTSDLTNDSGFQNATQVTTITNNTISTTNVLAQNLQVKAANISGLLKASQIEVGSGSNLLPNYDSFEQITNSTLYYLKSSALTADILSTNYAREGAKVMRLATGADATNAYVFIGHSANNYGQVRCSAGRYVFSFYARNTTGQSVLNCQVYGRNNIGSTWSDSTAYTYIAQTDVTITGDYVRGDIPFEVTSAYPVICVRFQLKTASRTIYVDCLQLERVDNANQGAGAWHPAGSTIINGGNISAGTITANALAANSVTADKISVTDLSALGATIGGWTINQNNIRKLNTAGDLEFVINAPSSPSSNDYCLYSRVYDTASSTWYTKFGLTYGGQIFAEGQVFARAGSDIGGVGVNSSGVLSNIGTVNVDSGINTNLGWGASYGNAVNGVAGASSFYVTNLYVQSNVMRGVYGGAQRVLTLQQITTSSGKYLVYAQQVS